jgi:hypothetical protein
MLSGAGHGKISFSLCPIHYICYGGAFQSQRGEIV